MGNPKFAVVADIPTVERESQASKYDPLFDAAVSAAPKAIVAGEFKEPGEAANHASYLRSLKRGEGFTIAQRGLGVYVKVATPEELEASRLRAERAAKTKSAKKAA